MDTLEHIANRSYTGNTSQIHSQYDIGVVQMYSGWAQPPSMMPMGGFQPQIGSANYGHPPAPFAYEPPEPKTLPLLKLSAIPAPTPIGEGDSGFVKGSYGNIRRILDADIQERYDFSGHDNTKPHLNLDYGKGTKGLLNAINKSSAFSPREKDELIGDLHSRNLFDSD